MDPALLESAVEQLAGIAVQKDHGPRDPENLAARAQAYWRDKGQGAALALARQLFGEDAGIDSVALAQIFTRTFIALRSDRTHESPHPLASLRWQVAGPPASRARACLEATICRTFEVRGVPTALTTRGAMLSWADAGWRTVVEEGRGFDLRSDLTAVYEARGDRIVACGRVEQGQPLQTRIFERDHWRVTAGAFAPSRAEGPMELVFDTALGRVLGLIEGQVAVLKEEDWLGLEPRNLGSCLSPGARVLAHDPRTQETLVVAVPCGSVTRLDLGGAERVGELEAPNGDVLTPIRAELEPGDRSLYLLLAGSSEGWVKVDLGPAFELSARVCPRLLGLPPTLRPLR